MTFAKRVDRELWAQFTGLRRVRFVWSRAERASVPSSRGYVCVQASCVFCETFDHSVRFRLKKKENSNRIAYVRPNSRAGRGTRYLRTAVYGRIVVTRGRTMGGPSSLRELRSFYLISLLGKKKRRRKGKIYPNRPAAAVRTRNSDYRDVSSAEV